MVGLEKKLGSVFALPGKDAKPEERSAAITKLQQAGLMPTPPESPDKYEFPIDAIPEAMRDQKTVDTVRAWAHKNNLSAEAVKELADIETARYTQVVEPALKYTNEQGQKAVNEFAESIGMDPKQVLAHAGNWLAKHFSPEEVTEMEKSGFANSPVAIKFAARAGLDTGEDITVLPTGGPNGADAEFEEAIKFTSDKNHPDYNIWMKSDVGDPRKVALQQRYEAALKKKYGTGPAV
jgi:hypothetical protein